MGNETERSERSVLCTRAIEDADRSKIGQRRSAVLRRRRTGRGGKPARTTRSRLAAQRGRQLAVGDHRSSTFPRHRGRHSAARCRRRARAGRANARVLGQAQQHRARSGAPRHPLRTVPPAARLRIPLRDSERPGRSSRPPRARIPVATVEDQVARVLVVVVVVDGQCRCRAACRQPITARAHGVAGVQPKPRKLVEHAERSAATWRVSRAVDVVASARFMTLVRRRSSNRGGRTGRAGARRTRPRAAPLGRLEPGETARSSTPARPALRRESVGAGRLDARTVLRSAAGSAASRSTNRREPRA